jgi:hypothetical protein
LAIIRIKAQFGGAERIVLLDMTLRLALCARGRADR